MIVEFNERLSLGGVQSRRDLELAVHGGYETIVDLRAHDEPSPTPPGLGPVAERQACDEIGLRYVTVAIRSNALDASTAEALRSAVANGGKVVVHCTTGIRAGWLGLMCLVCDGSLPFAEYVTRVDELGLDVANAPRLREFCVREIIRSTKRGQVTAISQRAAYL